MPPHNPHTLLFFFFASRDAQTASPMLDRELVTYPTWERHSVVSHCVANMNVKDRRHLFQQSRLHGCDPNLFFPHFGVTLSEFAVWYTLASSKEKRVPKSS